MSALGVVLKILLVIFAVLFIIIVLSIVFFDFISNWIAKRVIEDSGLTSEQKKQLPQDFNIDDLNKWRTKRAIEHNGLVSIMKISKTFSLYYEHNNQLPESFNWCDRLMEYYEEEGLVKKYLFNIAQLGYEYHFAFNKNLSLLSKEDLPSNLVLVFEADGEFNLSGGPELLEKERAKDKYFSVENRYIYILFLDGTIAKYRLQDGAIALAKKVVYEVSDYSNFGYTYKEEKAFSEYYRKGETPYGPLRWE